MSTPLKFPYYRISNIYIPLFYKFKNLALLKIGLKKDDRITKPQAFIDTGSQYCLFNNTYAKYLGIDDFKKVEKDHVVPLQGIGGKSASNFAYFHKVDLIVYTDQKHLSSEKTIIAHDIDIGFLKKILI